MKVEISSEEIKDLSKEITDGVLNRIKEKYPDEDEKMQLALIVATLEYSAHLVREIAKDYGVEFQSIKEDKE